MKTETVKIEKPKIVTAAALPKKETTPDENESLNNETKKPEAKKPELEDKSAIRKSELNMNEEERKKAEQKQQELAKQKARSSGTVSAMKSRFAEPELPKLEPVV
uniref:Uncharacterized protein n=1 Tax=Acrobeloides nanus TaxID=290746 RepID=A0A914DG78_9BILA